MEIQIQEGQGEGERVIISTPPSLETSFLQSSFGVCLLCRNLSLTRCFWPPLRHEMGEQRQRPWKGERWCSASIRLPVRLARFQSAPLVFLGKSLVFRGQNPGVAAHNECGNTKCARLGSDILVAVRKYPTETPLARQRLGVRQSSGAFACNERSQGASRSRLQIKSITRHSSLVAVCKYRNAGWQPAVSPIGNRQPSATRHASRVTRHALLGLIRSDLV